MPNFNAWAAKTRMPVALLDADRAVAAWYRIQREPKSITIERENGTAITTLGAQTVRIEFDETMPNDANTSNTRGIPKYDLIIFGVKGHPTITDTDLKDKDKFVFDGKVYEIRDVIEVPGEIQAWAVRYG